MCTPSDRLRRALPRAVLALLLGSLAGAPGARADDPSTAERLALAREYEQRLDYEGAVETLKQAGASVATAGAATPSVRALVLGSWLRCAGGSCRPDEALPALRAVLDAHGREGGLETVLDAGASWLRPTFEAAASVEAIVPLVDLVRAHPALAGRPHPISHRILLEQARVARALGDPGGLEAAQRAVQEATAAGDTSAQAWALLLRADLLGAGVGRWPEAIGNLRAAVPLLAVVRLPQAGLRGRQVLQDLLGAVANDPAVAAAAAEPLLELFRAVWGAPLEDFGGLEFPARCALEAGARGGSLGATVEGIRAVMGDATPATAIPRRAVLVRCAEAAVSARLWSLAAAALRAAKEDVPADLGALQLLLEERSLLAQVALGTNDRAGALSLVRSSLGLLELGEDDPSDAPWFVRLASVARSAGDEALVTELAEVAGRCVERKGGKPDAYPRDSAQDGAEEAARSGRPLLVLRADGPDVVLVTLDGRFRERVPAHWRSRELDVANIRLAIRGGRISLRRSDASAGAPEGIDPSFVLPPSGWLVVHADGVVRSRGAALLPPVRR